jgi:hypothetical protein
MSEGTSMTDGQSARFEYYWEKGRVVEYTNHRDGNRGRWPKSQHEPRKLIVAIQRRTSGSVMTNGPAATPDRLAEALLRCSRYYCDTRSKDIGKVVPKELLDRVKKKLRKETDRVTRQWESTANEEGQTGFFAGLINEVSKFQQDDWEATIRVQVFSPQTKEPRVGADMGIIVDLRQGDNRVVKAALVQAKRVDSIPDSPMKLPDLKKQIAQMQKTTNEAYGMIQSPEETYLFDPDAPGEHISIESFFVDKIECRRGDRQRRAVAQAYDRSILIDLTIATGEED